jgi:hypothetical protein
MKLLRVTWYLLVLLLSFVVFAFVPVAHAEPGLQSDLTAISGQGSGHVNVSPTADEQHDTVFIAQVTVNVQGARPNTTFTVTRFVDQPPDGVCTEAGGGFTLGTLTTSQDGAGASHFVRMGPPSLPKGFQFDLDFHVVGDDGTVLLSGCMTVTAK